MIPLFHAPPNGAICLIVLFETAAADDDRVCPGTRDGSFDLGAGMFAREPPATRLRVGERAVAGALEAQVLDGALHPLLERALPAWRRQIEVGVRDDGGRRVAGSGRRPPKQSRQPWPS
jgi:hypothetical protein